MIRFLKCFVALLNAIVVGLIIENGLPSPSKIDSWITFGMLTVSSYCLYFSLLQAIMAGKNLSSAWINRKKAEQWVQIKKLSRNENVTLTVGKFGYFITTLVLLTLIGLGITFSVDYHRRYTERIVVAKVERTNEEAKRLYEEAIKKEKKFWDSILDKPSYKGQPKLTSTYYKGPQDFKYKKTYGQRGFKQKDLIQFALVGLYGLINLTVIFSFLIGGREPSLFRLLVERKRLEEEARLKDLNS